MKLKVLPFLLIPAIIFLAFFLIYVRRTTQNTSSDNFSYEKKTVKISDITVTALVADTPAKQALGLGKRDSLSEGSGMLFPFKRKSKSPFWMKDMLMPIDIIWISDGKVVKIDQDVPFFPPDTPDYKLPLYFPPEPVDYVLEVSAGFSKKFGIKQADPVSFL